MPRNFTIENFYLKSHTRKKMKFQDMIKPDELRIQNLLAYSKALSVLKSQREEGKQQTNFYLILN